MWLPAITIVPPEHEPLEQTDVVAAVRGVPDDEAPLVAIYLAAARGQVEAFTSTRLVTQTVKVSCGSFADLAHFEVGPVRAIESVSYVDQLGQAQTLDPSRYERFGAGLVQGVRPTVGTSWPATRFGIDDAVSVVMTVGYGDLGDQPSPFPAPVLQAILLLIGDFYQNREDTIAERGVVPATLPNGVSTLLCNFRL